MWWDAAPSINMIAPKAATLALSEFGDQVSSKSKSKIHKRTRRGGPEHQVSIGFWPKRKPTINSLAQ